MRSESFRSLNDLDDDHFLAEWADMTDEQRSALSPADFKAACFERVNRLKAHVAESSKRAERRILRAVARVEPGNAIAPLDWRDLATREPPQRRWLFPQWIGPDHVTLLVGNGGVGKTTAAQQFGSAGALAAPFIEQPGASFRSLLWACEDEPDELWRRQTAIAAWLRVPLGAFAEKFFLVPRHGADNLIATTEFGRLMFTPRLEELRQQANDLGVSMVVLDNVSHLYGGNENERHGVTAFLNALVGALPGTGILLLAHPSRAFGSEFSGSSAWENAARTRLYLGTHLPDAKPEEVQGAEDLNVRILARRKANYAAKDIRHLTYQNGVLVPEASATPSGMVGLLRKDRVKRTLMDAARRLAEMDVRFTDSGNSPDYMPKVILAYKLGEGTTKTELAEAMHDAMLDRQLVRDVVGHYSNRAPMYGLKVAP